MRGDAFPANEPAEAAPHPDLLPVKDGEKERKCRFPALCVYGRNIIFPGIIAANGRIGARGDRFQPINSPLPRHP
jgi:hypothetical protein